MAIKEKNNRQYNALSAFWQNSGMLVIFIIGFAISALFVPRFLSWTNMNGLALSIATVGMIACTMMFCLASGDFDLSVGSVVACAGVLAVMVANETGSTAMGILAGVVSGVLVGLLNGFVIAKLGINALITTLATMQIVRGAAFLASDGKAVSCKMDAFNAIGNFSPDKIGFLRPLADVPVIGSILKFTTPVWVTLACFTIFGVLLNRTTYGRNTLAIGGNKEAARLAGINVDRTKILIFALQGLIAALAGVIIASRLTSGQPKTSEGLELRAISACVLGGVSLSGGVATISGVVVGVLIMGSVQNIMDLKNIDSFWQLVVSGLILLAAVLFDRFKQKRSN